MLTNDDLRCASQRVSRVRRICLIVAVLAVIVPGAPVAQADCPLPLDSVTVALWHCDEGADTTAYDVGPGGFHGALSGGVGWGSPLCGNSAVSFSGQGQTLRLPGELTCLSSGTIECSFKWDGIFDQTDAWIFDQFRSPSSTNFGLVFRTTDRLLRFAVGGDFVVTGATAIEPGRWYDVACTWDGTTAHIYLDGFEDGAETSYHTPESTSEPLLFGMSAGGASDPGAFRGLVDEIRLSNVARAYGTCAVQADFEASPTSGDAPLTVDFTDRSQGVVVGWEWDFDSDDVIDAVTQNAVHTYCSPGTYSVTLRVTDGLCSRTRVREGYIVVNPTTARDTLVLGGGHLGRGDTAVLVPLAFAGTDSIGALSLAIRYAPDTLVWVGVQSHSPGKEFDASAEGGRVMLEWSDGTGGLDPILPGADPLLSLVFSRGVSFRATRLSFDAGASSANGPTGEPLAFVWDDGGGVVTCFRDTVLLGSGHLAGLGDTARVSVSHLGPSPLGRVSLLLSYANDRLGFLGVESRVSGVTFTASAGVGEIVVDWTDQTGGLNPIPPDVDTLFDLVFQAVGPFVGGTRLTFDRLRSWFADEASDSLGLDFIDDPPAGVVTAAIGLDLVATLTLSQCMVASSGDVDGDGYEDIMAYGDGNPYVYVYRGGPAPLADTAYCLIAGNGYTNYGNQMNGSVGDLDGSPPVEHVVGYTANTARGNQQVRVYRGGAGCGAEPWLVLSPPPGCTDDSFGNTTAGGGDFNGDGHADLLVGFLGYDPNNTGAALLYYGGPAMDGAHDLWLPSDMGGDDQYGTVVAFVGDLDGDGYADALVTADQNGQSGPGYADVIYGTAAGPPRKHRLSAPDTWEFGYSGGAAGDFNGDGHPDIVVTARVSGQAFVWYGGAALNDLPDVTLPGIPFYAGSAWHGASVVGVGDVDDDGFDDVAIGVPGADGGRGAVYLYCGGTDPATGPTLILPNPGSGVHFGFSLARLTHVTDPPGNYLVIGSRDSLTAASSAWTGSPSCRAAPVAAAAAQSAQLGSVWTTASIVRLGDATAGAGIGPHSSGVAPLQVLSYPNPFVSFTTFEIRLPAAGVVGVDIYDISGRRLRHMESVAPGGVARIRWDGCDSEGHHLAMGTYFAVARMQGQAAVQKIVLLR